MNNVHIIESEYNKGGERLGLSVSVKVLDKDRLSTIYVPEEIKGFVQKIYERLGMKYDLCQSDEKDDFTEMSAETSTALKMSKIIVRSAGNDIEKEFRQAIMDAIKQKSEMIELVLCLNSKSCSYAYEVAKKCEFSLSGIIPGAENGDYIIMQMLLMLSFMS